MTMVTAFVLIDSQPARTADLAEEIADLPEASEVYSVAGRHDLVVVLRVRENDQLADVVTRHIASLDGVVHTRTLIAFRAYSKRDLEAMWAIGAD
jgi:DNA-binding Lrp family transcriptional regulator